MAIEVELVSPERIVYTGEAKELIVRTTNGEIGFQPGHVPFVGVLGVAEARIYLTDGSMKRLALHRGFVEIADDHCTILSDTAEFVDDIDVGRAQAAKQRAEQALAADAEDADAAAALRRAEVRLQVASAA